MKKRGLMAKVEIKLALITMENLFAIILKLRNFYI
jgi:hypothetical protein